MAALGVLSPAQAARADPPLIAVHEEAVRASEEIRHAQHIQALERDLRSLQDLTRRNAVALETMRGQLEKTRGERDTMALLALVLAFLLVVGAAMGAWRSRVTARRARPKGPDINLGLAKSTTDSIAAPIAPGAPRMHKAERQIDLQQQVDFLQSVGAADRAVAGLLYKLARELEEEDEKPVIAQHSRLDIDLGKLSAPETEAPALASLDAHSLR
jgi:hypothetical protein